MQSKQLIIGMMIFAIVTIGTFLLLNSYAPFSEGVSVVMAIVLGGAAEFSYRRIAGKKVE